MAGPATGGPDGERPSAEPPSSAPRRGPRIAIAKLFASQAEIEAADEQRVAHSLGSTLAVNTLPRSRAEVSGVLRSVTYRPQDKVPALLAELYDGSGSVDLIWLGRRDVAGIQPGRRIVASGMVCPGRRRNTIFNPRYELAPVGGE